MTPAELDRLWVESMYEVGMGKMIHHVFAKKIAGVLRDDIIAEWIDRVEEDTCSSSEWLQQEAKDSLKRDYPAVASFGEWLIDESQG